MSKYTIIYDDAEGLNVCRATGEQLSEYINDGSGVLKGYKILDSIPGPESSSYPLWSMWPDDSMLIFKDDSIYVPRKVSMEVTKQVEIWEVD